MFCSTKTARIYLPPTLAHDDDKMYELAAPLVAGAKAARGLTQIEL
jgi:hypothetical protein